MDMRRSLPDLLLSGLSDFVAARMGLNFPQERWADLDRGMVGAARELGYTDAEACARWLLSAPLTRSHVEILASHLTVGESYFFREKRALEVLEEHIVPELMRRRREERRVRIWSAGCCTGEEPYSIAMLLHVLDPDPRAWNVTILATDINPRFLRKAAEGVYSEWSFRDTPASVRDRYFRQRGDGRFELHPQIKEKVRWSYLNLAEDVYPSLLNGSNAMDVIFCRNVLMYFTADRAKRVVGNLFRSLVDGGWLIVSPTETSRVLFSSFSAVQFPGVVLYRKILSADPRVTAVGSEASAFAPEPEALRPQTPDVQPAPDTPQASRSALRDEALPPGKGEGDPASVSARRCANQGRLAEARQWCERAIAADKMNPARHYLLAAIQQEQGQATAAVQSLQQALYLDPGFVLAHFALGNIELSRDRRREADRHFANALAILRARPRDGLLPESEGLTAGRLVEIITAVQAGLPRVAAAHS